MSTAPDWLPRFLTTAPPPLPTRKQRKPLESTAPMNAPRPHNPTPAVPPVYAPPVPPFQYVPPARPVDNFPNFPPNPPAFPSAFDVQVGGSHYSKMKIQPMEYLIANNIPFAEGSVIKYASRWRDKGGLEDLKKARHILDMLIEMETAKGGR